MTSEDGNTAANVEYDAGAPGAVIAGADTAVISYFVDGEETEATVPATNLLFTGDSADLATDTISGIRNLVVEGDVTLTNAQYSGFTDVTGGGTVIGADGGTYDLSDKASGTALLNLTAQGWDGTTLIGNDADGETLTASLFGDDTLTAGNGAGDVLKAGEGVDTLTGGSGGDTFYAENGLTAGSSVTGTSGSDTLAADQDISGADISGIATLETNYGGSGGDITLTASQFAGFTAITGGGSINAADAGTYDLSTRNTTESFTITAANDNRKSTVLLSRTA